MLNTIVSSTKVELVSSIILFLLIARGRANDPDIISDFVIPANTTTIDENFFTYTGLRTTFTTEFPTEFKATKANMVEFPALVGQSISYLVVQLPVGAVNPPHLHPRSSELLLVISGYIEAGFVDTSNKLYTQLLQPGDIFVVPKGLLHYQYNANANINATALTAFGSANGGKVTLPVALFETGIDDEILAKSFRTDIATVQKIKAGLAPKEDNT
ncbi:putative germin-like protein 9-2 [Apium graveolens]|uniref:putative germin-like protein 9-2 n=1 Tax=Apium graveolens TaxID=4045 RepID=UPI003D792FBB